MEENKNTENPVQEQNKEPEQQQKQQQEYKKIVLDSKFLEVKEFQQNQNKLIAKIEIPREGTTIIEENPIEVAVLPFVRDQICNYCLEPRDKLLKCGGCKTFSYCSQFCQKRDWTAFHKQECKIYGQIKQKKYKLTSQFVLLLRLYLKVKKDEKTLDILNDFLVDYEHFPQQNVEFFKESAYMVLKSLEEPINETNVAVLIKINMQIYLNAFTVQDPLYNFDGMAVGLYPKANFINHSCKPNCLQIFKDRKIFIKTLRPIEIGEELTISYFDVCKTRQERQDFTKQHYMFNCSCSRCQQEEEIEKQQQNKNHSIQIKCDSKQCAEKNVNIYDLQTMKCKICENTISEEKIEQIGKRIYEIKQKMRQNETPYNERVDLILEARKTVEMSEPSFCQIISNFIVFSIQKEQYRNAGIFLKLYIKNFEIWYGQDLPLKFQKLNELSKLLFYENKLLKAEKTTQQALKLAVKFYNPDIEFQELSDLKQRYEDIRNEIKMSKNN